MFVFGDPLTIAITYIESVGGAFTKDLIELPQSPGICKTQLTFARMAYNMAVSQNAGEEPTAAIVEIYDAWFSKLSRIDSCLRDAILANRHHFLGGKGPENRAKYAYLAGLEFAPDGPYGHG